tara:strand:- start:245 stop:781 length:537 start_codon:yes stop_codon:yes gene_type:complete
MRIILVVKKALIALTTILVLLSIGLDIYAQLTGPLGPIPGGPLTGTHIEEQPIWRKLLTSGRFIEVEWSGDPPYSVTLDPHVVGEELYIWSSSPNSWTKRIERDPEAIVRIESSLYQMVAIKVSDDNLLAKINQDRAGVLEAAGISFHLKWIRKRLGKVSAPPLWRYSFESCFQLYSS